MVTTSNQMWAHDVGLAATRFHRWMKNAIDDALKPFGLSGAEYGALLYIDRNAGTSNADLARFLMVTPQALGRMTARLQDRDILGRDARDAVGRRRPLSLTANGTEALRRAAPAVEAAQAALLSPLSADEQRSFLRALEACSPAVAHSRKDPA